MNTQKQKLHTIHEHGQDQVFVLLAFDAKLPIMMLEYFWRLFSNADAIMTVSSSLFFFQIRKYFVRTINAYPIDM